MLDTTFSDSAGSIQSVMANDGVTGIPIGLSHTAQVPSGSPPYQTDLRNRGIANGYITGNEVYTDSLTLYRKALAAAPANSIDLISIGYLNNYMDLMQSPADSISPLTGLQLITAKVHRLWIMGGLYPSGNEHNFANTALAKSSANYVTANWPTPIVYSGNEVGLTVISGASIAGRAPADFVAQALLDWGSTTRPSWDPMNALVTLDTDPDSSGYTSVWGSNSVNSSTGDNTFTPSAAGKDRYLVKRNSNSSFQTRINTLIDKTTW